MNPEQTIFAFFTAMTLVILFFSAFRLRIEKRQTKLVGLDQASLPTRLRGIHVFPHHQTVPAPPTQRYVPTRPVEIAKDYGRVAIEKAKTILLPKPR